MVLACQQLCCQSQLGVSGTSNAATFYTTLTTLELLGKSGASMFAGMLADAVGYHPFFIITTLVRARAHSHTHTHTHAHAYREKRGQKGML